jgi:hypothetical protein
MNNFGFNLLGLTQSVIGKQSYQLEVWAGRVRNDAGYMVDSYDVAVTRHASVQPLPAEKITPMGLEFNKVYITIFDQSLVSILSRSENPDRIIWQGYYWKPEPSSMDWNDQGGWNQVVCVRGDKVA